MDKLNPNLTKHIFLNKHITCMCFIKIWIKISVRVGGRDIQKPIYR